MDIICGLKINSTCVPQAVFAVQDDIIDGRPSYIFTINLRTKSVVNGLIRWNKGERYWSVEDTKLGEVISVLPIDRVHPYGTNKEWKNYSSVKSSCLFGTNGFSTEWLDECPPTNFRFCCGSDDVENYFGLQPFDYFGYYNKVFYIETVNFSGCCYITSEILPTGAKVYSEIQSFVEYNSCSTCTGNTYPCYEQPVYKSLAKSSVLTATTLCGVESVLVNECEPITILPLVVECSVTNVSEFNMNDGSIELLISGGTPPYTIFWDNGESSPILINLTSGNYQYTISDYYNDFTITNFCTVEEPAENNFTRPFSPFCLRIKYDNSSELNQFYFTPNESLYNGYPQYFDEGANVISWITGDTDFWIWEGVITNNNLRNYSNTVPPLNNWVFIDPNNQGIVYPNLGPCVEFISLCMTVEIQSFSTEPYYIQFTESGIVNGKTSWVDIQGQYQIFWTTDVSDSWVLFGLPNTTTFQIINSNPQSPPLNGWSVLGDRGNIRVINGNCFSETICVEFEFSCGSELIQLTKGDDVNDNVAWYGNLPCNTVGTWFIYYDTTNQNWKTSGLTTVVGITLESTYDSDFYLGPFGDFISDYSYYLFVSNGNCNSSNALRMSVSSNNPEFGSDGNIILLIEGGDSPYQYSIDGGTTYSNFPLFDNLKGGTYVATIKDNNGKTIKQNVILENPQRKTSYLVSLKTSSKVTVNTNSVNTMEYITLVNVDPPLPMGVEITFDLIHNDTYEVSPSINSSTLTLGSLLTKNGVEISVYNTLRSYYNKTNTLLGCQNNSIFVTATTEYWNGISIGSSDQVKINTSVSTVKNGKYPCYISKNVETYSLSNLTINGCSGCEVINEDRAPESTSTTLTPITPSVTPTSSSSATILCFDYVFSSLGYTDTKTPDGSYKGYNYYNLTNGVVWSSGGVYWYWSDVLGNDTTYYDRLYNGVQSTPNSLSYTWQNPLGSTGTMNSSLIGSC